MQPSPPPDPAYADQYPAQPVAPPQYPAPQPWQGPPNHHAPVGYPYQPPAPAPSMTTAIIAGVLAILLGLYQGFQAVVYVLMASITTSVAYQVDPVDLGDLDDLGWLNAFLIAMGVGSAVSAIALLVGAVLLLVRKLFSRWLIALGCVIAIVVTAIPVILVQLFLTALSSHFDEDFSVFSGTGGWLAVILVTLFVGVPLATTVLVFLPSTRRYCVVHR